MNISYNKTDILFVIKNLKLNNKLSLKVIIFYELETGVILFQ